MTRQTQEKEGARKLWGKVSSFVIKKMGSGTAEVLSNRSINPARRIRKLVALKSEEYIEAKRNYHHRFSLVILHRWRTLHNFAEESQGQGGSRQEGERAKQGQFQLNLQVNTHHQWDTKEACEIYFSIFMPAPLDTG